MSETRISKEGLVVTARRGAFSRSVRFETEQIAAWVERFLPRWFERGDKDQVGAQAGHM